MNIFDFLLIPPISGESLMLSALLVMPFVFGFALFKLWRWLKEAEFIKAMEWVLLEIKLPRQIDKSPQAMEVVLNAMHQTNEGNWYTKFTKGELRPWFSLELISDGGKVRFFIRTTKGFKNLIESQIYSQYPNVEITEVEDYTNNIPYALKGSDWDLAGFNFTLTKEDPYPIKTYVDYGLDKDPKEEYKVDPFTPLVELLGSMRPGEQMWFQFLIMATKERFSQKGSWFKKTDWKGKAEEEVEKIIAKTATEENKKGNPANLSPGDKVKVEAIQRSVAKPGFDTGFRTIYLAKKDIFDKVNFGAMASVTKQFSSMELNGFKPLNSTSIKYPWNDLFGRKEPRLKWYMFDSYRRRSYFYPPYKYPAFVLNTEELATLYHLPGQVAETPTFPRIESRTSEPPSNLPTQE